MKISAKLLLAGLLLLSLSPLAAQDKKLLLGAGGPTAATTTLPGDLANLKVWYKADAMVANGDATNDGDAVAKWTDSATGNNWPLYDQNTSSKRPAYKTNQVNSLPSVNFDGSSDELRTGTTGGGGTSVTWGTTTLTAFIVLQDSSPNPGAGVGVTWLTADDGSGFPMFLSQRYTNTGNARWRGYNTAGTGFEVFFSVTNGTASTDWHILSLMRRATETQVYVDGVAQTATASTGTAQNKSTPLWMGGIFGGGFAVVKVAEAYVYTDAKSDADRHSQESYLSNKYGISVSVQ